MGRSIKFYTTFLGLKLVKKKEIPQNNAEIAFLIDPKRKGSILELTFYRNQKKFLHEPIIKILKLKKVYNLFIQ